MRNRLSLLPLLLAVLVGLGGAPAAAQADYKAVFADCNDGTIDRSYTARELQQALQNSDAFTGDYSECADAIYRAQQAQATGSSGTGSSGGPTGSSAGAGSGSTPTGTTAGGTPTAPGPSATAGPSASGGAPTTPDRQNDARDADAAEKAAALAAATASADARAGDAAAELKNTGVPAAALDYGASDTTLPGPLLLSLVACVLAACLVGGTTGAQALRRRRGR